MKFNTLPILALLILILLTETKGQHQKNKAVENGTYEISYQHGTAHKLIVNEGRYSILYDSGEIQNGDILIYDDSFILKPYQTQLQSESNTDIEIPDNSETKKPESIVKKSVASLLQLSPCNWYVLNHPNRKTSKFIIYSHGLHVQCGKGRLKRLRTK